jgi:hypothetical protein
MGTMIIIAIIGLLAVLFVLDWRLNRNRQRPWRKAPPSAAEVRDRIQRAVAEGASEQLKQLLDAVVGQILVESRACIQPDFVAPMVRTRAGSRRRNDTRTSHGVPSPSLWVTPWAWGRTA